MAHRIRRVDYFHATVPDQPGEAFRFLSALADAGVDLLYAPGVEVMYPRPASEQTRIEVPGLSDILCGASRPGQIEENAAASAEPPGATGWNPLAASSAGVRLP